MTEFQIMQSMQKIEKLLSRAETLTNLIDANLAAKIAKAA